MLTALILLITLLTALLPLMVRQVTVYIPSFKAKKSHNWLPLAAAFLFITAWFLPDIHISNETTTFQQHFVGGGAYAACLYVYAKKLFDWKLSIIPSLIILFAWVSALGVANELLEFALTKLGLAQIGTNDTDWDLLANTLGAVTGYLLLLAGGTEKPARR